MRVITPLKIIGKILSDSGDFAQSLSFLILHFTVIIFPLTVCISFQDIPCPGSGHPKPLQDGQNIKFSPLLCCVLWPVPPMDEIFY